MIKKFYASVVFLAVFCISATALLAQEDGSDNPEIALPGFQLLLYGGFGYVSNSDMETFAKIQGQDTADEYNQYAQSIGGTQDFKLDETSKPNTAWAIELEMRFFPGSYGFGFGIGTGFHYAESVSKISSATYADKVEYTTTLVVLPVVGTLYYETAVNSFSIVTFGAGIGKYYGMFDGTLTSSHTIPFAPPPAGVDVYEPLSDGSTVGYHIKAEYSLLFKPLCVTVGVVGRYVQFDQFKDDNLVIKMDAGLTGVSLYLAAGLAI
jgi:hypothetical protein